MGKRSLPEFLRRVTDAERASEGRFYDLLAMAYHRLFPAWEGVLGGAATVR
jgi:hypothetical protein